MNLSKHDYYNILDYYNLEYNISDKFSTIKKKVEQIISGKLCRCIKKVKAKYDETNETKAIAICKNSVINKKNINIYKFSCKKPKLLLKKTLKTNAHKIYKKFNKPINLRPQKKKNYNLYK
jgi:hypothetical protein